VSKIKRISTFVIVFFILIMFSGGLIYYKFPSLILKTNIGIERWSANLDKSEVAVNDHKWVFLEGGKGDAVVFLHGFGMHKDFWGGLLKYYSSTHRVIAPDLPGFGESTRINSSNYDIKSQVKRLHLFLKKKELKSFHLVGFSMGGGIAAYYSSMYPNNVKSLFLISPYGVSYERKSDCFRRLDDSGEVILIFKTDEQYERLMQYAYFSPPSIPKRFKTYIIEEIGAKNRDFHGKIFKDLMKEGRTVLDGILPKIAANTLLIWGKDDRILDVSCVKTLESGIRQKKIVVFENAGHLVYVDRLKEVAEVYHEFLKNLE
jgi:pimeloyl-ACP methyl ester carboxylesterase